MQSRTKAGWRRLAEAGTPQSRRAAKACRVTDDPRRLSALLRARSIFKFNKLLRAAAGAHVQIEPFASRPLVELTWRRTHLAIE
mmetsp:Transcript_1789/g.7155  ORF Transcript_1789/g.7155 Transcript_1789/m.7155 type:complete len:84 (+) Transcript_1789:159-410(+)